MRDATIDLSNAGPAAPIMRAAYEAAHREGRMVWLFEASSTWSYDSPDKAAAAIDSGKAEHVGQLEFKA